MTFNELRILWLINLKKLKIHSQHALGYQHFSYGMLGELIENTRIFAVPGETLLYPFVMQLDNPTLYTSPYLVATPRGYTKHYYAGEERVASRLGEGITSYTGSYINYDDANKIGRQTGRIIRVHHECLSQTGIDILQYQFGHLFYNVSSPVQETYYYNKRINLMRLMTSTHYSVFQIPPNTFSSHSIIFRAN